MSTNRPAGARHRSDLIADLLNIWNERQDNAERLIQTWELLNEVFDDEFTEDAEPLRVWVQRESGLEDEVYDDILKKIRNMRKVQNQTLDRRTASRVRRLAGKWEVTAAEIIEAFGFDSISDKFTRQLQMICSLLSLAETKIRICRIRQARINAPKRHWRRTAKDRGRYTPADAFKLAEELRLEGATRRSKTAEYLDPIERLDTKRQSDTAEQSEGSEHLNAINQPHAGGLQDQTGYPDDVEAQSDAEQSLDAETESNWKAQCDAAWPSDAEENPDIEIHSEDVQYLTANRPYSLVLEQRHSNLKPSWAPQEGSITARGLIQHPASAPLTPTCRYNLQPSDFANSKVQRHLLDPPSIPAIPLPELGSGLEAVGENLAGCCHDKDDAINVFSPPGQSIQSHSALKERPFSNILVRRRKRAISELAYNGCIKKKTKSQVENKSSVTVDQRESSCTPSVEIGRNSGCPLSEIVTSPPSPSRPFTSPIQSSSPLEQHQRQLFPRTLERLSYSGWLDDSLLFTALTLFATEDFYVVDPLLLSDTAKHLLESLDLGDSRHGDKSRFWILPLHHSRISHWSLAVADREAGKFVHFDSLPKLGGFKDAEGKITTLFGLRRYALGNIQWEFRSLVSPFF